MVSTLKRALNSDVVLVLVTVIWGTTFSLTKMGLAEVPPLMFITIRFLVAFGLLLGLTARRKGPVSRRTVMMGAFVGLLYAAGFATQTAGIQFTTASKAAFITGLSVILVPIFSSVILRRNPGRMAVAGSVLAFAGLAVLSVDRELTYLLSYGDLLVLACAVFFALHIIFVGKWAQDLDPVVFTTIQVGVTALVSGILALNLEEMPSHISPSVWAGLAYLALFATFGTTLMQVWAQRHTNPTRTAIIFTLEPVFAAFFALLLLGEIPGWKTLFGGSLIIAGIILAELSPSAARCDEPVAFNESPVNADGKSIEEKC